MSRVADAVKKSTVSGPAESGPLDDSTEPASEAGSWMTDELPWELDDESPAPPLSSSIAIVSKLSDIAAVRRRSLVDPTSASRDELALLVQRIFQPAAAERRVRSVLFTALGSEGSSATLCAAAADAMAGQTSASVCLVDSNLRSPSLHASFGLTNGRGLSDALLDGRELGGLLTRVASNVWLLPSGSHGSDAVPYLTADRIRPLLLELLSSFDYLFVDTSPAGLHGDATLLGPLVDGAVLVVTADATRREAARRTVENLRAMKVPILGAVLTNRSLPIPESIYRML
jgi:protein-tyrosine kinase